MGLLKRVASVGRLFGIDPSRAVAALRGLPTYLRDLRALKRQLRGDLGRQFPLGKWYPCLADRGDTSGVASGPYFYQDLLVARWVFENGPAKHVDIASRIDGFVAHVAAFREIEVLDVRPQPARVPNVRFAVADLTARPFPLADYCDSLSCLHAIEHFGLGRYGDPIDAAGHLTAIDNFHRLLTPGGTLYLSTPIGPQRIEFNGHRVFAVGYLLEQLAGRFRVVRFAHVDDAGRLHQDAELTPDRVAANCGCVTGCGIFELRKVA